MHIVNAMFSKGLGGIEQALVDYCEALKMEGHKVSAIIAPKAKIKVALLALGVNIIEVKNFSAWDFFAMAYIKKIMAQLAPDVVITHGNRAVSLVSGLAFIINGRINNKPSIKNHKHQALIGVTHNYSIKRIIGLDAIFATTNDLKTKAIALGQPDNKVFKLPNMVRVEKHPPPLRQMPGNTEQLVIGTMGRFVKKKGFDIFIRAIAELKTCDLNFKAVIGGGGEEEYNLKNLAEELGLKDRLEFIGWVNDKAQFFAGIDIFCLPSLHEPFGIILLEAFAHGKAVISANSEGPSEIISNNEDALLVPKGDSKAIADAILYLCHNSAVANKLSQNAFAKAQEYDIRHFASSLTDALTKILKNK